MLEISERLGKKQTWYSILRITRSAISTVGGGSSCRSLRTVPWTIASRNWIPWQSWVKKNWIFINFDRYPIFTMSRRFSVGETQGAVLGRHVAKHPLVDARHVERAHNEDGGRAVVPRLRRLVDRNWKNGGHSGRHTTVRQIRMVLHGKIERFHDRSNRWIVVSGNCEIVYLIVSRACRRSKMRFALL